MKNTLWAASALLADGWASNVEIEINTDGNIERISPDCAYRHGKRYELIIPGIPNVHSHAHQRAMAGLGECASITQDGSHDSFWTWRKVMYHYLERIQPEHLQAIAAQLYVEMLTSGYTCVGEFQYLHHQPNGKVYQNPAEMTLRCLQAAEQVGIGFTALPVLYRYGGFGNAEPLAGQTRFLNGPDTFIGIVNALQTACNSNANYSVGIAPHSLRAINQELLDQVIQQIGRENFAAIHIHIAEQSKEVSDCLNWSGQRPVEWLLDRFHVDSQWCLIHATHMSDAEIRRLAQSKAVVGLCPTTEANLGDGFFNALEFEAQGGHWAIGSDSHISIDPVEELRWLEYGQRLQHRSRNLFTSKQYPNSGRYLLDKALQGGTLACGRKVGRIEQGYRADLLVLDTTHPRLVGRREDDLLDSWIFASNDKLVKQVYVGGKHVVKNGQHPEQAAIAENFRKTLEQLQ